MTVGWSPPFEFTGGLVEIGVSVSRASGNPLDLGSAPALLFLKWKDHYFPSLKDLPLMSPAPIFKLFKDRKTFIAKITAWFKISGFATLGRSPNNQRFCVSQINTSLLIANPFVMCMLSNLQYLLQYLTYLVMRKICVQGGWQSRAMTSCECPQSIFW